MTKTDPMLRSARIVLPAILIVAFGGVGTLKLQLPIGPSVLALGFLPLVVLPLSGRRLSRALPDLVFGIIDTGLLAIPALWGGMTFGVAGAVAGGVVGDAITDSIAGFFEGHVAAGLRSLGFDESRDAVTTALGKMSGCLFGAGLALTVGLLLGVSPDFL